jgi:hypothetical protein
VKTHVERPATDQRTSMVRPQNISYKQLHHQYADQYTAVK